MIKSLVKSFLARRNLALVSSTWRDDITEKMHCDLRQNKSFMDLYEQCQPFTMTSIERMYGLYEAVQYIVHNQIPGDLIECGVWRGGILILDDYGHWQGARQATDEYMAAHNLHLLPHRLDYTGRMWIK